MCCIDDYEATDFKNRKDDKRKEMGLDWMLRPKEVRERKAKVIDDEDLKEPQVEEVSSSLGVNVEFTCIGSFLNVQSTF